MNEQQLLLRDIHLPNPVSWWPPAIGWWFVSLALCGVIALCLWWWRRRIAIRNSPAAIARVELTALQVAWQQHGDTLQLLRELSVWLRRVSISMSSRQTAASLTGPAWQQFLGELAGAPIFSDADARLITTVQYRRSLSAENAVDGGQLLSLCERWLEAVTRRARRR